MDDHMNWLNPWEVSYWPLPLRRAFLVLFPITFPIWFVTMLPVLFAVTVAAIATEMFQAIRDVWER